MSCSGNERKGIMTGAKSLHLSVAIGFSIQNPSASIENNTPELNFTCVQSLRALSNYPLKKEKSPTNCFN